MNDINQRKASDDEKERLLCSVNEIKVSSKFPLWRESAQYGTKQIIWDDNSTVKQTTNIVAEHFGLSHA